MKLEDIRAYVNRDWGAIADEKQRAWLEAKQRMTPSDIVAKSDELRRFVPPSCPKTIDRTR